MVSETQNFRDRLRSGAPLFGSFLKMATTMPAEILGVVGYDFVVVDEEHSALNRETTDQIILACRASGLGAVVRVRSADPAGILSVLDSGADGILVPHVADAETAQAIVASAKYTGGHRGFAPTTRAGDFGARSTADHVNRQDQRVCVIAMIEDPEGVENIDDIVATDGLDAVFVGRGDLSVAYQDFDGSSGVVAQATDRVQAAAQAAGCITAILPGSAEDAKARAAAGASVFILSSDQGFLRSAAATALNAISSAIPSAEGN